MRTRRLTLLSILAFSPPALAAPLDPQDFASLGSLTTNIGGVVTIDTTAGTLTYNGIVYNGVIQSQNSSLDPQVAVFRFDQVNLDPLTVFTITGSRPLAILSSGDMHIAGLFNLNGGAGGQYTEGTTVAGGGSNSSSPGPGAGTGYYTGAGSGGGFGGQGGDAAVGGLIPQSGGPAYGDLRASLEGGSAGGTAYFPQQFTNGGGGGAGGGAIEFGATGNIIFDPATAIIANGGAGGSSNDEDSGGGGAGGGIFIHAANILGADQASFLALGGKGGNSGNTNFYAGGGGGGGGRIVFSTNGTFTIGDPLPVFNTNVNGGPAGNMVPNPAQSIYPALPGDPGNVVFAPKLVYIPLNPSLALHLSANKLPGTDYDFAPLSLQMASSGSSASLDNATQLIVQTAGGFGQINIVDSLSLFGVGLNDQTSTLNARLAGSGTLAKVGSGSVTLTANNTQAGVDLRQGTLIPSSTTSLMSPSGLARFSGGGLRAAGNLNFTGTQTFQVDAPGGFIDVPDSALTVTLSSSTTLTGTGTLEKRGPGQLLLVDQANFPGTLNLTQGTLISQSLLADGTFAGQVTGSGSWTIRGPYTTILSSSQPSFTGQLNVENGQLRLNQSNRLRSDARVNLGDGGELFLNGGVTQTLQSLTGSPLSTLTLWPLNSTLILDSNTDSAFHGTVANTQQIIKRGTGKWTLDGALADGIYAGQFLADNGVLEMVLSNPSQSRYESFTASAGAEIQFRMPLAADSVTFNGSFSGAGVLRKLGPGLMNIEYADIDNQMKVYVDEGALQITPADWTQNIQNASRVIVRGDYTQMSGIRGPGEVDIAGGSLSSIPWTGLTLFTANTDVKPLNPTDTISFPHGLAVNGQFPNVNVNVYHPQAFLYDTTITKGSLTFNSTFVRAQNNINIAPDGTLSLILNSSWLGTVAGSNRINLQGRLDLEGGSVTSADIIASPGSVIQAYTGPIIGDQNVIQSGYLRGLPELRVFSSIAELRFGQNLDIDFGADNSVDPTPVNLYFDTMSGHLIFDRSFLHLALGDPATGHFDQFRFAGQVTPGGFLQITLLPDFNPTLGTQYPFMTADGFYGPAWGDGQFQFFPYGDYWPLPNGLRLQLVAPGTLQVVPEPSSPLASLLTASLLLTRRKSKQKS